MAKILDDLRSYQLNGVSRGLKLPFCLILCPPGSGKTRLALAVAWKRFRRGQINRVLIVCQNTITDQWKEVIAEFIPEATLFSDPKQELPGLSFHVTHYERARTQLKLLRRKPFDMMIVDECHKLKSFSSMQSRRLWLIGKTTSYRLALTGTPIEKNELDFWAQMRFVDDRVFGDSWTEFKTEWTLPSGFMGKKRKLKQWKRALFLDMVGSSSFIVPESVIDLPPAIDLPVIIPMVRSQAKVYETMERDFVVEYKGLEVAAPMIATSLIRLHQIAGGFLSNGDDFRSIGSCKLDGCRDLLESHDEPVVIYARFIQEIKAIAEMVKKMRRKPSIITGDIRVGTHKSFDVLICQVGIVAGLDGMQHVSSTGIFFSKSFSSVQLDQAKRRLQRSGQQNRVRFYHMAAKNSIDTDLDWALEQKTDTIAGVIKHLLRRRN